MRKSIRRVGSSRHRNDPRNPGRHRREHWCIDNQIYFITARCREGLHAFETAAAKSVFWQQFDLKTEAFGFTPIITALMSNHYHTLGHLRSGNDLPQLMQRFHGAIAKLTNDLRPTEDRIPRLFREVGGRRQYFDGAIRDGRQFTRCYRYIERQAIRHRLAVTAGQYKHIRADRELVEARERAEAVHAFLTGIPYRRYRNRSR